MALGVGNSVLCLISLHFICSSADDMVEFGAKPNDVVFDEMNAADLDLQDDAKSRWPTTFWRQYTTLTQRQYKISKSNIFHRFTFIKYTASIIFTSLMWWQVPRTEERLDDKLALVSK